MSASRLTLKLATSLDGRIATASGESRWITGPEARTVVHRLRAEHDAVVVGIETALADDPDLTVRLEGYDGPQPARVVIDSGQRLPENSRLAQTAMTTPTLVITTSVPRTALLDLGVVVLQVDDGGRPSPASIMQALGEQGMARLFLEGGGQLAASFLAADLVDALEWFRAPMLLGGEGRSAVGPLDFPSLALAPRFRRVGLELLGEDAWERYERI